MTHTHRNLPHKLYKTLALCLALTLLAGCGAADSAEKSSAAETETVSAAVVETAAETAAEETVAEADAEEAAAVTLAAETTTASDDDMFTDRDLRITYDESESVYITLSGDTASCDSSAVSISGGTVTITEEGTYILSGTLDDGMIIIDIDDADKVQLVLDGVSITSATSAAIYVRQADKVFITTAEGSENYLANGGEYIDIDENSIDGVIFSKDDLTLNGAGILTIEAAAGHGIVGKDDLVIASGTYTITAASHGIQANDSVRIAGGSITITAGKDGIQAENDDDAELGFVYIIGGSLTITAEGDGISAGAYLSISGGSFDITTGGGSGEAQTTTGFGMGFDYWNSMTTSQEDSVSTKGLKAEGDITITDGAFTIDACDDALHSNGNVTISGGAFIIQSGDDGVHADNALVISGGEINITQSYEGLEGLTIDITGGTIYVTSSDDGLNAAGGNDSSGFGGFGGDMFAATEGAYLSISGGTLYVNASGDGLDSNGSMYISGGETYVSGPTDSMNGALDFNGECVITGGILVAVSAGGMEESVSSTSTQGVITVSLTTQQAGTALSITDSSGNVLASFSPDKSYSTVIISCPELTVGESYTITAGSASTTVTMSSLIYGSAGMGAMTGNMGGRGNTASTEVGGSVSDSTVGTMPDAELDSGMNYDGGMNGNMAGGMGGAPGGM